MAHGSHHIVPIRTLAIVFGVLVALTFITVVLSQVDLGPLNVPLAVAIAGCKAIVVAAVFMALKYDNPVNMVVVSLGIIFAIVFLAITLTDTALRGAFGIQERGYIPFEVEAAVHELDENAAEPAEDISEQDLAPAQTGEEIYSKYCKSCHTLDGSIGAGPTFQGIGQARTREQIVLSIRDPEAELVEGFPSQVMATTLSVLGFNDGVSDAEFAALVTFLEAQ